MSAYRTTVLVHLGEMADPATVTAAGMADARPELNRPRWQAVLDDMARVGPPRRTPDGRRIAGARLLHVIPGDPTSGTTYALAPEGWAAARRLTARRGAA